MGTIYCEPQLVLGFIDNGWDQYLRIVLYLIGLLWCFVGISIIADIFMGAIEVITSKEKIVTMPDGSTVTVKIWNATVANLTLMALGSSAPEILLSVIEILSGSYFSGDLGPSTIVGSAAFNLMFISAACVVSIPKGEGRNVHQLKVFYITSAFSLFAYIWLLIILIGTSKDRITITEAILTLMFFPVLVVLCYLVDAGVLFKKKAAKIEPDAIEEGLAGKDGQKVTEMRKGELRLQTVLNKGEVKALIRANRLRLHRRDSETSAKQIKDKLLQMSGAASDQPVSRARLRMNACRMITGRRRIALLPRTNEYEQSDSLKHGMKSPDCSDRIQVINPILSEEQKEKEEIRPLVGGETQNNVEHLNILSSFASFDVGAYTVPAQTPFTLYIPVTRRHTKTNCKVMYHTIEGTAESGKDFNPSEGILNFAVNEGEKKIPIQISVPACEEQKQFSLGLKLEHNPKRSEEEYTSLLLKCEITILPKAQHSVALGFLSIIPKHTKVSCLESDEFVAVTVTRREGYEGKISCTYATSSLSAKAGQDFQQTEGELEFGNYEMVKQIWIPILDDQEVEKDENFKLSITQVDSGDRSQETLDKGNLHMDCIITIKNDDVIASQIGLITKLLNLDLDMYRIGSASYKEQFIDAISVGCEPGEKPTIRDWVMHLIALPWKLLFALVPPTIYCDGKLCFIVALGGIAVVTVLVGDLASLLGCSMMLKDSVTAITFVALGTSLPDTFASMAAAKLDKHADASIGNITGSNSVNVFLGIGLPWSIAAIYWKLAGRTNAWELKYGGPSTTASVADYYSIYPDGGFIVPSGDLGISVLVFTICAITCLGTLMIRRKLLGFELGATEPWKTVTGVLFLSLWLVYVLISAFQAYGYFS